MKTRLSIRPRSSKCLYEIDDEFLNTKTSSPNLFPNSETKRLTLTAKSKPGISIDNYDSLIERGFNTSYETIFIVHGYSHSEDAHKDCNYTGEYRFSKCTKPWQLHLITQLACHKNNYNIFNVKWRSDGNYPKFESNSLVMGRLIARILEDLISTRDGRIPIDLKKVHLIGCGHIAGFAGKDIFKLTGEKIGRITSLDPGKPLVIRHTAFGYDLTEPVVGYPTDDPSVDQLRTMKSDADFVMAVHSYEHAYNSNITRIKSGHFDLYLNNGFRQPHCRDENMRDYERRLKTAGYSTKGWYAYMNSAFI